MTRQGFEAYKLYLALQRHFSSSYDFFKYNGKVNVKADTYEKRNDKFSFEKLTKIVPQEDRVDFYVAHFVDNPKEWIRNMSKPKYEEWVSKLRVLLSKFEEDMYTISQHHPSDLMNTQSGIPTIHDLALKNVISIETLILMDNFFPFIDKHKEEVKVPFVFPDHVQRLQKYRPFLMNKIENIDIYKDTMKNILLENK